MADPGILVLVLILVAIVIGGIVAYLAEKRRREEMTLLAARLGLVYVPDAGRPNDDLRELAAMRPGGHGHRLVHVLRGRWKERDVLVMDLRYKVKQGKSTVTKHRGVALVRVPQAWPWITIEPEHFGHKLVDALGADDIDFESQEFSDAFWVRGDDRRFAHDLVHARAMEYLLARREWRWEVRGGKLALWREERFRPEEIEPALEIVSGFLDLVPSYVAAKGAG